MVGYDGSGNRLSLGRVILELAPNDKNQVVVFKNLDDNLNYTRSNLRVVDKEYKSRNATKTWGKSKYKGVSWDSDRGKWKAVVRRKGKTLKLFIEEGR